jgi:AraC family transcriptional regulator of adaptative response/methylated-DNA-[protein]-cysteine methyltransferase
MTPSHPISVSYLSSTLGEVLVASTPHGLCAVALGDDRAALEAELRDRCGEGRIAAPGAEQAEWAARVLRAIEGETVPAPPSDLDATPFQLRVWAALRAIPRGATCTYAELARAIGAPEAMRAVGAACGQNPLAVIVPCHRVVRSDGGLGGYRWGLVRKRALLARERPPAA